MSPLSAEERAAAIAASPPRPKYAERLDRERAAELLARAWTATPRRPEEVRGRARPVPPTRSEPPPEDSSLAGQVEDVLNSSIGRAVVREVIRGIFGGRRER